MARAPWSFEGDSMRAPEIFECAPQFQQTVDIPYTMHRNYASGRGREAAERAQAAGGLRAL